MKTKGVGSIKATTETQNNRWSLKIKLDRNDELKWMIYVCFVIWLFDFVNERFVVIYLNHPWLKFTTKEKYNLSAIFVRSCMFLHFVQKGIVIEYALHWYMQTLTPSRSTCEANHERTKTKLLKNRICTATIHVGLPAK